MRESCSGPQANQTEADDVPQGECLLARQVGTRGPLTHDASWHDRPPTRHAIRLLLVVSIATMVAADLAVAQAAYDPRRDSVLIARDLDGDGHVDYVVLQVRGTAEGGFENRIAVYLDGVPKARRPSWTSAWENEGVGEIHLETSMSLAADVGLLSIAFYGGDADNRTVLLVHGGRAHVDIEHQIDYGQGNWAVRGEGSAVVIDASVENLSLRRAEVARERCGPSQRAMIRLRYDSTRRRFVERQRLCLKAP